MRDDARDFNHAPRLMEDAREADLKYREVITGIDSMCQIQLGQINALIATMLRAMETERFWRHPLAIKESLGLMQYLADDLMNFVNGTAEEVGCNFVDEVDRAHEERIVAAFREASDEEARFAGEIKEIARRGGSHA